MLHTPRRALAAALVLLAVSHVLFADPGPTRIAIADAARHEGQSVEVEGIVRALRIDDGARFTLVAGGHALEAFADDGEGLHVGVVARATGRLARLGPDLVLFADAIEVGEPPPVPTMPLSVLTRPDPPPGPLRVTGTVEDGGLRADGVRVRLGDGPWPDSGRVTATVLAVFDQGCGCLRLHAHAVRPWTD